MKRLISVIVPVYKVEEYLDQCVQSIVDQTYRDLEIILVDDGSPDRCPQMCDSWAARDPRIRVVHKKNGGLSDARNAGLDICAGEYIAFVDSDDWILPEMYERLSDALEREAADICACNIVSCYPDREVRWGARAYTVGDSELMLDRLYSDSIYPVCAWNKLYRRELWEDFRFPVGKLCEDAFTTYLLLHKADRIVQITDALYCYRIRSESIMTSSFSAKSMDEEEAWRKNYEFIRENYPHLFRKAYTFYLQGVRVLVRRLKPSQRSEFSAEYDLLKKTLSDNLFFMLVRSTASLKYRVRFLLDVMRL